MKENLYSSYWGFHIRRVCKIWFVSPEKSKKELNSLAEEKEEIKISIDWMVQLRYSTHSNFSMEYLTNLWNNQPTTVMGIGVAILVLLGIYVSLLNTYQ